MNCIVPGCQEPPEYVRPIGDGWDAVGMCEKHLQGERNAVAQGEWEHQYRMDEADPAGAAMRREAERVAAEERRQRAMDQIDPTKWASPDGTRYGLRALEGEVANIRANGVEGNRRRVLNDAAFALGQLVAGGELHEGTVQEALRFCGEAIGLRPREITDTIRYGLRDGMKNPRSAPADPTRSYAS